MHGGRPVYGRSAEIGCFCGVGAPIGRVMDTVTGPYGFISLACMALQLCTVRNHSVLESNVIVAAYKVMLSQNSAV